MSARNKKDAQSAPSLEVASQAEGDPLTRDEARRAITQIKAQAKDRAEPTALTLVERAQTALNTKEVEPRLLELATRWGGANRNHNSSRPRTGSQRNDGPQG